MRSVFIFPTRPLPSYLLLPLLFACFPSPPFHVTSCLNKRSLLSELNTTGDHFLYIFCFVYVFISTYVFVFAKAKRANKLPVCFVILVCCPHLPTSEFGGRGGAVSDHFCNVPESTFTLTSPHLTPLVTSSLFLHSDSTISVAFHVNCQQYQCFPREDD